MRAPFRTGMINTDNWQVLFSEKRYILINKIHGYTLAIKYANTLSGRNTGCAILAAGHSDQGHQAGNGFPMYKAGRMINNRRRIKVNVASG